MKRFAISDIHGCPSTFKALLKKIAFSKVDELYLLGDYIDRGPDSKGVIDYIWQLQAEGFMVHCLKGNHEQMMVDSLNSVAQEKSWLVNGGRATNKSFGVGNLREIPRKYIDWMKNLPHFIQIGKYILVHAGLNFKVKNPLDDKISMLWVRHWHGIVDLSWLGDRVIIHGHTPIVRSVIEEHLENLETGRILDIDGGCTFVESSFRVLCAFEMEEQVLVFQENIES